MTAANSCNIPSIGPISNTATGTFSSSYNKFYQPGYANLGVAFSGTTFTVQSEGGTAMSSTNPGFVALQSLATPGQIKRYSVTANQTFTQAGLGNNLFGVTTAVNITVDMPFYLYAVSNAQNGENTIALMISRVPHATIAPVAANIAQSGNTNATTQGSFYSLATITAADYASSPCLCIGSFRMRYSSSLWSVQTLNNADGVGQYQSGIVFTVPRGQFGAASTKYFTNNGGTAPDDSTGTYTYGIEKSGLCIASINFASVNTVGVGAVTAQYVVPYVSNYAGQTGQGILFQSAVYSMCSTVFPVGSSVCTNGVVFANNSGSGVLTNANFTNATQFGISNRYYISLS